MVSALQGETVQRAGHLVAVDPGHAVDLHHAACHEAEPIQVLVLRHTHDHAAGLTAILPALIVPVVIVHTATGLTPAVDHVPLTRALVQALILAIHPVHGRHLYPDAEDHQAFLIGGALQGEIICNLLLSLIFSGFVSLLCFMHIYIYMFSSSISS